MRRKCFKPLKKALTESVRAADGAAVQASFARGFERIDRLVEFKKGLIIRQFNRGLGFDLAVRYLAHKAFGAGKGTRYADTAAALAAIDGLRIENILKLDVEKDIYSRRAAIEKK